MMVAPGRDEYMNKYMNNPPSAPPYIQNPVVWRNKEGDSVAPDSTGMKERERQHSVHHR